jgi:hypothetical protein
LVVADMTGKLQPAVKFERDVDKWRALYARKYGREPPPRIVALKRFNQAAIRRRMRRGKS